MAADLIAGLLTATTTGDPVTVTTFEYLERDSGTPFTPRGFTIQTDTTSGHAVSAFTIKTNSSVDWTVTIATGTPWLTCFSSTIPNIGVANPKFDQVTIANLTDTSLIGSPGTTTTMNGCSKIITDQANSVINLLPQNSNSTTILLSNPTGHVDLTLPSGSTTILGTGNTNTFTQQQNFNGGISASSVSAILTNGDLSIVPNGTGNLVLNCSTLRVDTVKAKTTNGNLNILSNGTGIPVIGTTGLKFNNEALKFYEIGSYTTSFNVGTFSTGTLTFQFQRIGDRVVVKIPAATGTPSVNATWSTSFLPADITPATQQVVLGGLGIQSGTSFDDVCITIFTTGFMTAGFGNNSTGFGTFGICGWQNDFVIEYMMTNLM